MENFSLDPGFGASMSLSPFSGMDPSDVYSDVGPKSSLDIDTSRPEYRGLDESQRPSIDSKFQPNSHLSCSLFSLLELLEQTR